MKEGSVEVLLGSWCQWYLTALERVAKGGRLGVIPRVLQIRCDVVTPTAKPRCLLALYTVTTSGAASVSYRSRFSPLNFAFAIGIVALLYCARRGLVRGREWDDVVWCHRPAHQRYAYQRSDRTIEPINMSNGNLVFVHAFASIRRSIDHR